MTYWDILQLTAVYLAFFSSVFALPYSALYLWQSYKELVNPDYRVND